MLEYAITQTGYQLWFSSAHYIVQMVNMLFYSSAQSICMDCLVTKIIFPVIQLLVMKMM